MKIYQQYKDDVVFVGITMDDQTSLSEIEAYLAEFAIPWPNGYGAQDSFQNLNITNMAGFKFVIGRDGRIAWNKSSRGSLEYGIRTALGL